MKTVLPEYEISQQVQEHDLKNMQIIKNALDKGVIDKDAYDYMESLYSDGMSRFREVFYVLGKCFGAPRAPVMKYNYIKGVSENQQIKISEINPLSAYMVNHCLESDPMGNQFFNVDDDKHRVKVSASSIVSIIVAVQKNSKRALEKVVGKYYSAYTEDVANTTYRVIAENGRTASAKAIAKKVQERFSEKFITNASETVLNIIGGGHETIAVNLVRELDKIEKPYMRLKDVWRAKCLFELIPQARAFIEKLHIIMPDKIMHISDKFCDVNNPRNYRDAKIVINIGTDGEVIPMEIICQVRKIFEFERVNHEEYEAARKTGNNNASIEKKMAKGMEQGIKEYNEKICSCINQLFDRVGWNILYGKRKNGMLFDGFPEISKQYYPDKMIETVLDKIEKAVNNEVFSVTTAPIKLEKYEEVEIFCWMTKFILVSAMPYKDDSILMPGKNQAEKLFNFVMKEAQRYKK